MPGGLAVVGHGSPSLDRFWATALPCQAVGEERVSAAVRVAGTRGSATSATPATYLTRTTRAPDRAWLISTIAFVSGTESHHLVVAVCPEDSRFQAIHSAQPLSAWA